MKVRLFSILLCSTIFFASTARASGEADIASAPTCSVTADCASGFFCRYEHNVCGTAQGVCLQRPDICTMMYQPVCGCDGKTYASECVAATSGVSITKIGACENTASKAKKKPKKKSKKKKKKSSKKKVTKPTPPSDLTF